jgi:hypothetical protein
MEGRNHTNCTDRYNINTKHMVFRIPILFVGAECHSVAHHKDGKQGRPFTQELGYLVPIGRYIYMRQQEPTTPWQKVRQLEGKRNTVNEPKAGTEKGP